MADKRKIGNSEEFIAYRRHLRGVAYGWAGFVSFLLGLIYALYVFFAIATNGYVGQPSYSWTSNWNFKLPYFNTTNSLAVLSDVNVLWRYLTGLLVLIIVVLAFIIVSKSILASENRKSYKIQNRSLQDIEKEKYGLDISVLSKSWADYNQAFSYANITSVERKYTAVLISEGVSFDATQLVYDSDGMRRFGVLAVTEIKEPKLKGFIQLRTFSDLPSDVKFENHDIKRVSITNRDLIGHYAVYSDMPREDVEAFLTVEVVNKLLSMVNLFPSRALCVTIAGSELSILVDGMKLSYLVDLSTKIDTGLLEKQAYAFKTLNDRLVSLVYDATLTDVSPFVSQLGAQVQF